MNNIKASSALKTADSNKSRQRGSVSKSSLSIMKHVKGFGSIIDTSSKYWKETFNRNLCQCSIDTDEIIKEEIKTNKYQKTILTEYDNLNQLQEKSIRIDDDTLTYNYVYDYEYNEYKRGGYFSRLETSFNEDILFYKKINYTKIVIKK